MDERTPTWYDVLNPHFCAAVDNMTSVLTKASDVYNISSGEDQRSDDSDSKISDNGLDNSFELDTDRHTNTSGEMSDNSTKNSIASSSARGSSNVDDMEGSGEVSKAVTRVV